MPCGRSVSMLIWRVHRDRTHEYANRAATLKEVKNQAGSENSGGNASELGTVTIDFNPAADAEDRLRRLFTLLLNHVAREDESDDGYGLPADAWARVGAALETSARDAHTHKMGALYEAFEPSEARRIARRLEFYYIPKHGGWLNMAEIELSVFSKHCLRDRVADEIQLRRQVAAL